MSIKSEGIAPNSSRLMYAGFMAILAAGLGFALRGGIFDNWAREFNFSGLQLGAIGGAGFTGFCFGIIIGGIIVDKIGYGKLVAAAFLLHMGSAIVTFMATTPENAQMFLTWGMFIFAFANGTLEAVANPLIATLFPKARAHYLNILHAAWPLGMVFGAIIGWILDDKLQVGWKTQLAFYMIPTIAYGILFLGQKFPKSEASEKGSSLGEMFKDVGLVGSLVACYLLSIFFSTNLGLPSWAAYGISGALLLAVGVLTKFSVGSFLLFALFIGHLLVGAVELGTDGWIQNITGNLFTSEQGKYLFMWTSAIMFGLRFCVHFIEKNLKLSPIGLLLASSLIACLGLFLSSKMETFTMALVALGIYALGKTFFWPTMLAVASDRFPRSGAIAISIMGGIGMLSAGLIGGPGLGYSKDRFSAEILEKNNAAVYSEVKSDKGSKFLFFAEAFPIDAKKLVEAREAKEKTPAQEAIIAADHAGDRMTLKADSLIPLAMAGIFLIIAIYFKSQGGYKVIRIEDETGSAGANKKSPAFTQA